MATRGCGASSAGKPWTITSMGTVRINSRCSGRTASSSSRRYGENILRATPKWMGLFSFIRTIYITDDPTGLRRDLPPYLLSCCAVHGLTGAIWSDAKRTQDSYVDERP